MSPDPDRMSPEDVSAETSSGEGVSPGKLRTASVGLVLCALLLFSAAWSGWMQGDLAYAAVQAGCGFALVSMALRPQPLFRRWNDTSEWPRPETARGERLETASRVLLVAALLSILSAAILKLLSLV